MILNKNNRVLVFTAMCLILFSSLIVPFISLAEIESPTKDWENSINHLTGVHIAMYNGSGSWQYGKKAFPRMLDWAGCTYENVSGQNIIDGCLENFDILYWPGGDYVSYWGEMGIEGKEAVQEFVSDGGGYFGICAGAYYACDYMVWMDDDAFPPPDYKVEGDELNLDLFEGVAWGPIFDLADRPDPGYAMVQVNINHNHPITRDLPDTMQILYAGGPYFVPYENAEQEITILGKYDLTGQNAIVVTSYGKGRVFLLSPHAEVEEDSYRDGFEPFDELSDEGSDWPLLYNAIEWLVFQSQEDTNESSISLLFTSLILILIVGCTKYVRRRIRK